jgi:hypothetical protein
MTLREMVAPLIDAELAYAHFNALRTAAAEEHSGIRRGIHATIEYLLDPARSSSTYYNRGIGRSGDSLSESALRTLPSGIVGLETTPAQLTHEVAGLLSELRFRPAHQLCYLGVVPIGGAPVAHDVIRLGRSDVEQFFDLLQLAGVEFSREKRVRKKDYYCTEQFRAYVSKTADGAVSGWATMYVNGSTSFLGNSFTLPEFRKTGAHRALLAARLNDAAAQGLEAAFTDVEHGSQSHRNCARAGFRMLSINTIWKKQG